TTDLQIPDEVATPAGDMYDVRFELPHPAVTGEPFTIRPVFPADFPQMPSNALCHWYLSWGDDGQLFDLPNQDYGSVWIDRYYSKGGCGEWTFTLPYTPGLTYYFQFSLR